MSRRPFHPAELDGMDDPDRTSGTPADLLTTAQELERLDSGDLRPSDGFADRVMAAIAGEPLPAPMAVAGTAAREGRFGAMLRALRDTWHVAWTSGRPLAARAQAMAFVLLLVVAVGSVSGLVTVGAVGALFPAATPPATHPAPTLPAIVSPSPTERPGPTTGPSTKATPEPTETAEPGETPEPTETAEPRETERPNGSPGHTARPTGEPGETDDPSDDGGGSDDDGQHGPTPTPSVTPGP